MYSDTSLLIEEMLPPKEVCSYFASKNVLYPNLQLDPLHRLLRCAPLGLGTALILRLSVFLLLL